MGLAAVLQISQQVAACSISKINPKNRVLRRGHNYPRGVCMTDWLKTHFPKYISMPLIPIILLLGGVFVLPDDLQLNAHILQIVQKLPMLKLAAIVIIAFLVVSLCYVLLYLEFIRKPNFKDYIFNPSDQCWRHKSKQMWLCASCKVDNIFSPLAFTSEGDMICPKCDKPAKNFNLKHMKEMRAIFPSNNLESFRKDK